MIKKAVCSCLAVIFTFMISVPLSVFAIDEDEYVEATVNKIVENTNIMNLQAKGAVLMEGATGSVLIDKDCHKKLPIASVTKIMSMLLVMEAIDSGKISLDNKVTVSENSYRMGGSQVWLEPGEVFTVDELLKAVAIRSANDATVALAEAVAGSEETFVKMMNDRAVELGMANTRFLDCTGLTDEGHYSSAYDIAIMSRELLTKHPKIIEYTKTWHSTFRDNVPGKKPVSLDNTNKLIRFYNGAIGLKTGYTNAAGHCLSAAAERDGLLMIAVVLGEPDSNTRFAEARKLMDYGFANYEAVVVDNKGEAVQEVEIKNGLKKSVVAQFKDDVKLVVKKGSKDKINRIVIMATDIKAPVKAGETIGVVTYTLEGREIGKAELVAAEDVPKATFGKLFLWMLREWFTIGR